MLMGTNLTSAEWASITPADLPGDCECGRGAHHRVGVMDEHPDELPGLP